MKKKGFTLIELLAVIVILAIIALVAVPIVLNMIENAKKSAAISSTYGYIEAVETYQGLQDINGLENLEEGQYNIAANTTINEKTYNPINSYIKMKGKKATGGKIHITSGGKVDTANLCMNDYLVSYQNNKAEIISNDCGDIDLQILFGTNTTEWATSKTLTITYPNKNYDKYYKLVSGKASIGENQITVGQEIQVNGNEVSITLEENSVVEAWLSKNNTKKSETSYTETKIDTVELSSISATISNPFPILKQTGIVVAKSLVLSYEAQEGTSAYYSVDNGTTWIKYTGATYVSAESAKVKLVRDGSKRESSIVNATTTTLSDPLDSTLYDGDETTYVGDGTWYVNVDSSIIGQKVSYKASPYACNKWAIEQFTFINAANEEFDSFEISGCEDSLTKSIAEEAFTVPSGTVRIKIHFNNVNFYEFNSLYFNSLLSSSSVTVDDSKTLTSSGIVSNNKKLLFMIYNSTNSADVKLYYSKNEGSFVEYQRPILIENNDSIKTKITSTSSNISTDPKSINPVSGTTLPSNLHDGNDSTYVGDGTWYLNVDSSMSGKKVSYKASPYRCDSYAIEQFTFINANGRETSKYELSGCQDSSSFTKTLSEEAFTIPTGTTMIKIHFNNVNFYEIQPYNN